jgi:hypothetical protein
MQPRSFPSLAHGALISARDPVLLNHLFVVLTNERMSLPIGHTNSCRRIAEIQNELEELKNTVKRRSGSMVSQGSSEYSDRHRSYLPPELRKNGTYSPISSPYASPFTRTEDSYRSVGITGRLDTTIEDELFLTYFHS